MPIKWYLTPLNKPDRLIEGPFDSREEAQRRAVKRLSNEARVTVVTTLTMPSLLVATPKQYTQQEPIKLQQSTPEPQSQPLRTHVKNTHSYKLPDTINKLGKLQLEYLAHALNIELPDHATRNQMIDAIKKDIEG